MKKTDDIKTLAKKVREAMGADVLKRLGNQPLALAAGGIEKVLQAACAESAGHPKPVESAVRLVRVKCGSKSEPVVKPAKAEAP